MTEEVARRIVEALACYEAGYAPCMDRAQTLADVEWIAARAYILQNEKGIKLLRSWHNEYEQIRQQALTDFVLMASAEN